MILNFSYRIFISISHCRGKERGSHKEGRMSKGNKKMAGRGELIEVKALRAAESLSGPLALQNSFGSI